MSAAEREQEIEGLDRWHLDWLLNFVQRDKVSPGDNAMIWSLVSLHIEASSQTAEADPTRFAHTVVGELKRFLLKGEEWRFDVRATQVVLEPVTYPLAILKTSDWRTAFRLRAAELLAKNRKLIRQCERPKCGRVFALKNSKQTFCSKKCSDLKRLHAHRAKLKTDERTVEQNASQTRIGGGSA